MLRITELKLPIDHPEEDLRPAIVQRLGIASDDLLDFTLFKRSYDARKKSSELCFIYTVDVNVKGEAALLLKFADDRNINPAPDVSYKVVGQAPADLVERPIVVGFWPCGIFAGLLLAQMGFKPIILSAARKCASAPRTPGACGAKVCSTRSPTCSSVRAAPGPFPMASSTARSKTRNSTGAKCCTSSSRPRAGRNPLRQQAAHRYVPPDRRGGKHARANHRPGRVKCASSNG